MKPLFLVAQPVPAVPEARGQSVRPSPYRVPAWLHFAVIAAVAAITVRVALDMWSWTYDDVFIIYRYARNFGDGLGMVYNPGQAYLGTSSPGYTLLLAGMYSLGHTSDFPMLGSIVSTTGLFASGLLVWFIGVQTRAPLAGGLGALVTAANPLLIVLWGGEMPVLLALVLGAILAYGKEKGTATGVLLGLAVLTRPDSVVLVAAVGAHYLMTRRKIPLVPACALVLVLIPWTAYSWTFYGSPLPGTLEAKIAQGQAGWPFFLSGSLDWLSQILGPGLPRYLTLALIPVGVLTLAVEAIRRKPVTPWLLLLLWGGLFTAAYALLRVAFYGWYAVPLAVGLCILAAWGAAGVGTAAGTAGQWALRRLYRANSLEPAFTWVLALGVVTLLAFPIAGRLKAFDQGYLAVHRFSDLYERVGKWLAAQGGPSVSAAYLEVGEIGYYSNARIVDMLGLVTPGASAHVPSWDYDWAIERYRPRYYLASSRFNDLLRNVQSESWFTAAYHKVATFEEPWRLTTTVYTMDIYELKQGAVVPSPLLPVAWQRTSQQPLWLSPETPADTRPGQSVQVQQPGLSGIALMLGKTDAAGSGSVVLHLKRSPSDTEDLRRVSVPLGEIANNTWHTFRFDPIPDSAGKRLMFSIELSGTPAGEKPLALFYATDDLYPGGARYEGTTPAPGDLCFRAYVLDNH